MDRRRAQDLQDANWRAAFALLGESPWHGRDGPGPDQPDARADPPLPAGRPRRHDHGRRNQRAAVLP